MRLEQLREQVLEANLELVRSRLLVHTFGNASGISREEKLVVIKPSGVPYEQLKPEHMVVTSLDGKIVEAGLRPSSDLPTHLALYQAFPRIGGVAHTHSEYASAWAQAQKAIPCLGTTHADYFHGEVPVTRILKQQEIKGEYEKNTGEAIIRCFKGKDYEAVPGVLVVNHGPFTWGADPAAAAHHAVMLEYVARMAYHTLTINPKARAIARALHDRHYLRKHGRNAYYGQGEKQ